MAAFLYNIDSAGGASKKRQTTTFSQGAMFGPWPVYKKAEHKKLAKGEEEASTSRAPALLRVL